MKTRYKAISFFLVLLLALSMVSCGGEKKVVVASKPFAESYILAEIISQMIEKDTDITVELKHGIAGGTANIHPAMEDGSIDIYPEYTGTGWLYVLKEELINDPIELYDATRASYDENFNIKWYGLYGFNNTYTLALKSELASTLGIETFSDLARNSDELVFGAEYDFFERDDGYNALSEEYGFNFKGTKEMDIGLKYQAIGEGEVDVINAFSTDGLLLEYDMTILKDDKNYFPSYHAATLVRKEIVDKYPELDDVLSKLENAISDKEMTNMNYQVEKEGRDAKDVAKEFIESKGL